MKIVVSTKYVPLTNHMLMCTSISAMSPLLLLQAFPASFYIYAQTHAPGFLPHISRVHSSAHSPAWSCRSLCCMGPPRAASPAGAAVDATAGVRVNVSDRYVSPHPPAPQPIGFRIAGLESRVMGMCWFGRAGWDKKWHLWTDAVQPWRDRDGRALQWRG